MLLNKLRTPKFWNRNQSVFSKCLSPLAQLISYVSKIKYNTVNPEKISVPVIGIDSVIISGAGKTPAIDLVCDILKKYKYNPHILTSSHSGYLKNVVQVNPNLHSYLQVGDESLLSARVVPTWVGKNRIKASKAAINAGADIIVIDDWLKNNYLIKDYKILIIDSEQMFGNGYLFPAGPLIHEIDVGVSAADSIIIIGDYNEVLENNIKQMNDNIPIFRAKMEAINTVQVENNKVIAFCGLGYPNKFKKTLKECNYNIIDFLIFSDHHPYTITEIQKLINIAKNNNATLITTTKDYVKIPDIFKQEIKTIPIKLTLENNILEQHLIDNITSITQ